MTRPSARITRRALLVFGLLVAAVAGLGSAAAAPVGARIPAFEAPDEAGQRRALADYQGRTLVVVFLGASCPTSQGYAQRLQAIARHCQDKGAAILGVASNRGDDAATVARAKQQQGLPFPILIDQGGQIAGHFRARMTPTACVVDGEGTLRYFGAIDDDPPGTSPSATPYLRQAIDAVVAGRAPPTAETRPRGCAISP